MSEFSDELDGRVLDSHFHKIYRGDPPSRLVGLTEHLAVFVDLAPLVLGHLLVVPRREITSFAALDWRAAADWRRLEAKLRGRLAAEWCAPTVFEHGSSEKMRGSACITHAHLHLLPAPVNLVSRLEGDALGLEQIEGLPDIAAIVGHDRPYFYVQEPDGRAVVAPADVNSRPRQYLRAQAAAGLGIENSDWGVHVPRDLLRETMRRLQDLDVSA